MVIDFHSHILPGIDDGSKDLDTSIAILEACATQRVDCMVATPHFYGAKDRVDTFLNRRAQAYEAVLKEHTVGMPRIVPGAEVAFFPGISGADQIGKLTIEGTNILLLEMPFMPWSESILQEVSVLAGGKDVQLVLAHLERYLIISENKKYISRLLELPVVVQVNADSLLNWKLCRKTMNLLKRSDRCILGSDCHGIHHRPTRLAEARDVIVKKGDRRFLDAMDETAYSLLEQVLHT